jgi:prevent-host-death family protein
MEIGVRDLRNRTSQVIDAVNAGQRVVLTVHGDPVADIVPHLRRTRWLSGQHFQRELETRSADPGLQGADAGVPAAPVAPVAKGLLDTSVFIARESGRPLGLVPVEVAVSVVTLGELELGVIAAVSPDLRARRGDTLALARSAEPVPITESVIGSWARLVAECRAAGIQRTVKLTDALIAATAIDLGLAVVTQDADFDAMARACSGLDVLRV